MNQLNKDNQHLLQQGKLLPVTETFYSIQGEGYHTGKPAFFTRIAGCYVGCRWCDSKDTWIASIHPLLSVEMIIEEAMRYPARAMVVTGGEPLQYNLDLFCNSLKDLGFELFLETSGSSRLSGYWDWICLSPKMNAPPLPELFLRADELKVVICEPSDFEWAMQMADKVRPDCLLYLQPEWSKRETMIPEIVRFIGEKPQWRVSLQTHKYLGIP
ncbi:MAG: 7-carboxy-7-deazaguanine synthase QueE [Bacteroidales bacterium]